MLIIKPINDLSIYIDDLIKGRLWLKVIIGMFLGAGVGLLLNPDLGLINKDTSLTIGNWLNLPGEVFMKLVQMVMIPLIFASIISGIVNNVSDNLKSFGIWLLVYFVGTTTIAIAIGAIVALIFEPGTMISEVGGFAQTDEVAKTLTHESVSQSIPQSISNLIPVNPLQAILSNELLSVVIFTIIIGIALTQLEDKFKESIIKLIEALQKICMIVVGWALKLIPYAVFGLIAFLLSTTGIDVFIGLGYYIMVVLIGLAILLCFYFLIYTVIMRSNPFSFFAKIRDPLLLGFSTASSAAVIPLSMKTADEKLGVQSQISDFVIPIGATINMNGTALFQCVTVVFIAQAYGISLSFFDLLLITSTVVAASIGTPAIPGGGVIVLSTVLGSLGIPVEGLLIIIGIDRILGMFRTAVNVAGDLLSTVLFNKWYGTPNQT